MTRTRNIQSVHDAKVREVANRYKRERWKVKADLPGFKEPRTVYGNRPDIIARKGQKTRLIEIETRKSMKTDTAQRSAFQRYANLSPKISFKTLIAKRRR